MEKNKIIIISGVIVLGVLVIILNLRSNKTSPSSSNPNNEPTITGINAPDPSTPAGMVIDQAYIDASNKLLEADHTEAERSGKVGDLIGLLPYKGTLFSFEYNIAKNIFTVTLQQGQLPQANAEFDAFLKGHGVESQDWIEDLEVKLQ